MSIRLAIKVDVDTDRGTRIGAPRLANILRDFNAPGCFLFSLGPDNTGKAIRRVFRPGFLSKVNRTSVLKTYGLRTLLNGTLFPAPHIGSRNEKAMYSIKKRGFEVGVHCNDHTKWQDHVNTMNLDSTKKELYRACFEFERIFGERPRCAGAPGWQTSVNGRIAYDDCNLLFSSDSRGEYPYFPSIDGYVSRTLEIPTTLPTLDELLGRSEFPENAIVDHYADSLVEDRINVLTIHAEIEGMSKEVVFRKMMEAFKLNGVRFARLDEVAIECRRRGNAIPVESMKFEPIDGRSGSVATQMANLNGLVQNIGNLKALSNKENQICYEKI